MTKEEFKEWFNSSHCDKFELDSDCIEYDIEYDSNEGKTINIIGENLLEFGYRHCWWGGSEWRIESMSFETFKNCSENDDDYKY